MKTEIIVSQTTSPERAEAIMLFFKNEQIIISKKIADINKSFAENWLHAFCWEGEEMIRYQVALSFVEKAIKFFEKEPSRIDEWIDHNIKQKTEEIMRGDFMGRSTAWTSNKVHELTKEETVKFVNLLKELK